MCFARLAFPAAFGCLLSLSTWMLSLLWFPASSLNVTISSLSFRLHFLSWPQEKRRSLKWVFKTLSFTSFSYSFKSPDIVMRLAIWKVEVLTTVFVFLKGQDLQFSITWKRKKLSNAFRNKVFIRSSFTFPNYKHLQNFEKNDKHSIKRIIIF